MRERQHVGVCVSMFAVSFLFRFLGDASFVGPQPPGFRGVAGFVGA